MQPRRDDVILQAQILAQQLNICDSIGMQCSVYDEVNRWLIKAKLVGYSLQPDISAYAAQPRLPCVSAGICDVTQRLPPQNFEIQSEAKEGAVVRLRLKDDIMAIPHTELNWRLFVSSFLTQIAQFLQIDINRLRLHQGKGDELTDVVILANSDPLQSQLEAPPQELGRRLRAALAPSTNAINVPQNLTDPVNRAVRVEVFSFVVPVNAAPGASPSAPAPVRPSVDCGTLKLASQSACGSGFSCTAGCKQAFAAYQGNCLANLMSAQQLADTVASYKRYFVTCEKCTATRLGQVNDACGFSDPVVGPLPQKCSLFCSSQFVPYYIDCMMSGQDTWTSDQHTAVDAFYRSCARCTSVRQQAVAKICDPRPVPASGAQSNYYPATCTTDCSGIYPAFYDSCLLGEQHTAGVPSGSDKFRQRCQVAADGGWSFRLTLKIDLSSIVSHIEFGHSIAKEIATVLKIDPKRVAMFGVVPLGGATSVVVVNGQPQIAVTPKAVGVDCTMLVSAEVLDTDPRALVNMLALAVTDPQNVLYKMPLLQNTDGNIGVQFLNAGQHSLASVAAPSTLELAQAELQKAQEAGAGAALIAMLQAIVQYQIDLQARVDPLVLQVDLATVALKAVVAHHGSQEQVEAFKAGLALAVARQENVSAATLEVLVAQNEYAGDVAKGAPQSVIAMDAAHVAYAQAVNSSADAVTLALLQWTYTWLSDIATHKSQDIINRDRAHVDYMTAVQNKSDLSVLATDQAIVDKMEMLVQHVNSNQINAAEAKIQLQRALQNNAGPTTVAAAQAVFAYFNAVEQRAPPDTLAALGDAARAFYRPVTFIPPNNARPSDLPPASL